MRKPDWSARKKLHNLLDSYMNSNEERIKGIGELLVQNLLDTGEAYLVRRGNYQTDESGNVSEKPVEIDESERRTGMHRTRNTLKYWVPRQFVKTVNGWRHRLGLPSSVVFCVYHRSKAYVGKSKCPECSARMIDAYGYTRTPVLGGAQSSDNDIMMEYFGEREVLGYSGWLCQVEVGARQKTDNYKHLGNFRKWRCRTLPLTITRAKHPQTRPTNVMIAYWGLRRRLAVRPAGQICGASGRFGCRNGSAVTAGANRPCGLPGACRGVLYMCAGDSGHTDHVAACAGI